MKRAKRLFLLHEALIEGQRVLNASQWALEFGVDTRTLRRDLAFLRRESGGRLHFDARLKGYRYLDPKDQPVSDKQKKWTRLLTLIHRIASEPGRTAQQLADATGRAPRTIFRDLADLQDAGFPIYNDDGYRFAADAFLPPVNLTPDELFSLFVAARILEAQEPDGLGGDARRGLEKLLRATSETRRPDIGAMRDSIQVSKPSQDTGAELLGELHQALGGGHQVTLAYRGAKDDQAQTRRVDPIGLFCYQQVWYLHAFDRLRNGLRNFRLSRVESLKHHFKQAITHDPKLRIGHAAYHRWDLSGGETQEVQLKVTPELARWLEENPAHPSQRLEGSTICFQVANPKEMARWLAGLYGVEVLEPECLRRELESLGKELLQLYGTT